MVQRIPRRLPGVNHGPPTRPEGATTGAVEEKRRAALDAFGTRIEADVVPLVDDTSTMVRQGRRVEVVRTLAFASDHRCQLVVISEGDRVLAAEFSTELTASFEVELSTSAGSTMRGRWSPGRPVVFESVPPGPVRIVYGRFHRSRPVRQYETEWVHIP